MSAVAVADPRAEAVYAAESAALPDGGRRFRRFAELCDWVQDVTLGPWWASTFPDAPVEIEVQRRSRGATFSAAHAADDAAVLFVRDGSWDAVTVVHELAHVACWPLPAGEDPHGAVFCGVLLVCWRELLGVQAYGALRSEMDRRAVSYQRESRP